MFFCFKKQDVFSNFCKKLVFVVIFAQMVFMYHKICDERRSEVAVNFDGGWAFAPGVLRQDVSKPGSETRMELPTLVEIEIFG